MRSRAPVPAEVVDWRADRQVSRWTTEIDTMHGRAEKLVADTVVDIGIRLVAARDRLPLGHWLEWIDERLPFAVRTAQRCIVMSAWARAEPREFERLKRLGVGKLHYIVRLEPSRRRALQPTTMFLVRGKKKAIAVMGVTEMREALGLTAKPRDHIEIDDLFQEALHDLAGFGATTSELVARKSELAKSKARKLKEKLVELADQLSRAFGV